MVQNDGKLHFANIDENFINIKLDQSLVTLLDLSTIRRATSRFWALLIFVSDSHDD